MAAATATLSHAFIFEHLLAPGERSAAAAPQPGSAPLHSALSAAPPPPTALVLLNGPSREPDFLRALWGCAAYVAVADGAANQLREGLPPALQAAYLPHVICGDMDSLTADNRAFYERHGVAVEARPEDQDSTDLQKCLVHLERVQAARGVRFRVVIFGAFGGRLDQEAQNINTLYSDGYRSSFAQIVLLSDECVASLLLSGTTAIAPTFPFEGPTVGLLPLGQPVASLTTRGLKWDVDDWACSFGGRMSTSNHVPAYDAWMAAHGPAWWARHGVGLPEAEVARRCGGDGESDAAAVASSPALGAGAAVVTVTASHPIVWTGTIDAAAVVAAWRAQTAARAHARRGPPAPGTVNSVGN